MWTTPAVSLLASTIHDNILSESFFSLACRYNVEEEGGCDDLDQGDNGWKIIHTDVFRFPPYKSLLCSVLGVGAQFLTLATGEGSFSNTFKHSNIHG